MIISVIKEIKNNENRVGLTPAGSEALIRAGHTVLVEKSAGVGSGFPDEAYVATGAEIVENTKELFDRADMIIKVKEPLPAEYDLFHEGQILYTYLHLAPEPELTAALLRHKVVGIAYETVRGRDGRSLPLLSPMSEIAGRMSVQLGAQFLESQYGGRGVLLGGVSGVCPGQVVIVGGGIVGTNAAKMAVGLGARVTIIDLSNSYNIAKWVARADLLISSVLIPGAKTPILVTEDMIKTMKPGSVVVDVAIDQGGAVETCDHCTTHDNPTFVKHGVTHYSVANIPGAVSRTSTLALTNATMPYALAIANKGYKQACLDDPGLMQGINTIDGKVTFKGVAEGLNLPYYDIHEILK